MNEIGAPELQCAFRVGRSVDVFYIDRQAADIRQGLIQRCQNDLGQICFDCVITSSQQADGDMGEALWFRPDAGKRAGDGTDLDRKSVV